MSHSYVSMSQVQETIAYIKRQEEHHKKKTFKEEFLAFLKKHNIEYDERYVWGQNQSSLQD